MGRADRIFGIDDQSGPVYIPVYVDTVDHSTFPLRPVNEPGLEGFIAFGTGKYADNSSGNTATI